MTMTLPKSIFFCEVGPRDGLQNEPATLSVERKVRLIEGVVDAGVRIVEIGSYVNPKAVPQMADTDEVARAIRRMEGVEYRALVANLKGVERALASGVNKVKLTVSASESHAKANLNKTPSELIDGFKSCTEFARSNGAEVSGAISTAFGCPFEGKVPPEKVAEIAERLHDLGITELSLSDTDMANSAAGLRSRNLYAGDAPRRPMVPSLPQYARNGPCKYACRSPGRDRTLRRVACGPRRLPLRPWRFRKRRFRGHDSHAS